VEVTSRDDDVLFFAVAMLPQAAAGEVEHAVDRAADLALDVTLRLLMHGHFRSCCRPRRRASSSRRDG